MARILWVLVVLFGLSTAPAAAQDARAVLNAAVAAMGAANLSSIQYSATGWIANTGQSFSLDGDWPRFEVTSYTRVIDYNARAYREEYVRRQGAFPPRGGGAPLAGEPRTVALLNGTYAWNLNGETVVPQPGQYMAGIPMHEMRQLEILMTPHGFLKGAMAANNAALTAVTLPIVGPTNAGLSENGRTVTILSYVALGRYRINGTINDKNLVELTTTWIPNPIYGDMLFEIRHLNYRAFGGVQFPQTIHVHQGDPVFNPGHNYMDIRVTDVRPNAPVPNLAVPDAVRSAAAPAVAVEVTQLAPGVWRLGGTHNSVAVEFADFVTVIEAPLNKARSIAVIDAVTKLVPAKPIKYVVNTHHHFDHSGGLRTYMAQGTTLVTAESNRAFYQDVMFAPLSRTLQPDRLSMYYPNFTTSRRPAPIEVVGQKYVISDGTRTMEVHPVLGGNHAQGMLVAYLPAEKILVNADLYGPPAPNAPPAPASAAARNLRENILRLKLQVAQHVPIHGRVGTHEEFMTITAPAPAASN
jgi:glyoxylase-like metal-dependent hydrolase (beta-lactamase superfamily II)